MSCLTCPTTSPKRSGVRRSADPTKHCHALAHGGVEVVVVRNGGDAKTGVVLRCGVCPIMVAGGSERVAGVPVICKFGCFLILALHTAHYLKSAKEKYCKMKTGLIARIYLIGLV